MSLFKRCCFVVLAVAIIVGAVLIYKAYADSDKKFKTVCDFETSTDQPITVEVSEEDGGVYLSFQKTDANVSLRNVFIRLGKWYDPSFPPYEGHREFFRNRFNLFCVKDDTQSYVLIVYKYYLHGARQSSLFLYDMKTMKVYEPIIRHTSDNTNSILELVPSEEIVDQNLAGHGNMSFDGSVGLMANNQAVLEFPSISFDETFTISNEQYESIHNNLFQTKDITKETAETGVALSPPIEAYVMNANTIVQTFYAEGGLMGWIAGPPKKIYVYFTIRDHQMVPISSGFMEANEP
ncbi:MAG: hypothetical protein GX115_00380 [Ruminiclostridium sp.]|nr:hypothetical protein [Ruminiclostridium sp.]